MEVSREVSLKDAYDKNDIESMKKLIEEDPQIINNQNIFYSGSTVLIQANRDDRSELVKYILTSPITSQIVDVNKQNKGGYNALMIAIIYDRKEAFGLLLQHPNILINQQSHTNGWTALHYAANNNKVNSLKMLLNHPQIDIHIKEYKFEKTTLWLCKSKECFELLLPHYQSTMNEDEVRMAKVCLTIQDKDGKTALDMAKGPSIAAKLKGNESNIILVGQGKAGNTALANNLVLENLQILYECILEGIDAPILSRVFADGDILENSDLFDEGSNRQLRERVFYRSFVWQFQAFYAAIQVICSGVVKVHDEKTKIASLHIKRKLLQKACYHVPMMGTAVSILRQMILEDEGIEGKTRETVIEEKIGYFSKIAPDSSSIDRVSKNLALSLVESNMKLSIEKTNYSKHLLSGAKEMESEKDYGILYEKDDEYDDSKSWLENMRTALPSVVKAVDTYIEQGLQVGIADIVRITYTSPNSNKRRLGAQQASSGLKHMEEVLSMNIEKNAAKDVECQGIVFAREVFLFLCTKISEGLFDKTYEPEEKMIEDMLKTICLTYHTATSVPTNMERSEGDETEVELNVPMETFNARSESIGKEIVADGISNRDVRETTNVVSHFLVKLPDEKSVERFSATLDKHKLWAELVPFTKTLYRVYFALNDHPSDCCRDIIKRISEEFPDCIAEADLISSRDDSNDIREFSETIKRATSNNRIADKRSAIVNVTIHKVDFPYPYIRKEEIIELVTGKVLKTYIMIADHFLLQLPKEKLMVFSKELNEPALSFEPVPFAKYLYRVHFPIGDVETHSISFLPEMIRRISERFPFCIVEPDVFREADICADEFNIPSLEHAASRKHPRSDALNPISVGVMDTGIRKLPELNIISGRNFIEIKGKEYDSEDTDDKDGHGTSCAGVIERVTDVSIGLTALKMMAPANQLNDMLKDISPNLKSVTLISWETSAICYALYENVELHNIRVLNCSYGRPEFSQVEYSYFKDARNAGITIITSAGNQGLNNDEIDHFPSQFAVGGICESIDGHDFCFTGLDNIVCVAATNESNNNPTITIHPSETKLRKDSNYGRRSVHLAAPGTDMICCESTDARYRGGSGTSLAAAYVSGVVAAVAQQFKTKLPPKTLIYILQQTVDKIESFEEKLIFGGKINFENAINDANKYAVEWMENRFEEIKSIELTIGSPLEWIENCIELCIQEIIPECIEESLKLRIRNRINGEIKKEVKEIVSEEEKQLLETARCTLLFYIKYYLRLERKIEMSYPGPLGQLRQKCLYDIENVFLSMNLSVTVSDKLLQIFMDCFVKENERSIWNFCLSEYSKSSLCNCIRDSINGLDLSNKAAGSLKESIEKCIKDSIKTCIIGDRMRISSGEDLSIGSMNILQDNIKVCMKQFIEDCINDLEAINDFIEQDAEFRPRSINTVHVEEVQKRFQNAKF